jgi:hypothetical protein
VVDGFCGSGGNVIQVINILNFSFPSMAKKYMQLTSTQIKLALPKTMPKFMTVRII